MVGRRIQKQRQNMTAFSSEFTFQIIAHKETYPQLVTEQQ